jgi:ethanolamine permease
MSVFGAIVMYILSMASLFKLRLTQRHAPGAYRAPMFPWFPGFALFGALVCLATMIYYNPLVAALFAGLMGLGYLYFLATSRRRGEAASQGLSEVA